MEIKVNGTDKRIKGVVTRYSVEKGYGFVKPNNPNFQDCIVLNADIKMEGFRKLNVGDIVLYSMLRDPKGFKAVNVEVVTESHRKDNERTREI